MRNKPSFLHKLLIVINAIIDIIGFRWLLILTSLIQKAHNFAKSVGYSTSTRHPGCWLALLLQPGIFKSVLGADQNPGSYKPGLSTMRGGPQSSWTWGGIALIEAPPVRTVPGTWISSSGDLDLDLFFERLRLLLIDLDLVLRVPNLEREEVISLDIIWLKIKSTHAKTLSCRIFQKQRIHYLLY